MIEVQIIEDTLSPHSSDRLTTFLLKYPRIIHAERLRHRMMSASVSSTRAIPTNTALEKLENDENIFIPEFTVNKKGMASNDLLLPKEMELAKGIWKDLIDYTKIAVQRLGDLGVHKQHAARPLEWFSHTTELVSATEWENFFALRSDDGAQPEIHELADKMIELYYTNTPRLASVDQTSELAWHIPFRSKMEGLSLSDMIMVSSARCARLSYTTFEGDIDFEADIKLFNRLKASGHWSPMEHVARPTVFMLHSNFRGFKQYRKDFMDENKKFDYNAWKLKRKK